MCGLLRARALRRKQQLQEGQQGQSIAQLAVEASDESDEEQPPHTEHDHSPHKAGRLGAAARRDSVSLNPYGRGGSAQLPDTALPAQASMQPEAAHFGMAAKEQSQAAPEAEAGRSETRAKVTKLSISQQEAMVLNMLMRRKQLHQ